MNHRRSRASGSVICYKCKEPGHMRQCSKYRRRDNSRSPRLGPWDTEDSTRLKRRVTDSGGRVS